MDYFLGEIRPFAFAMGRLVRSVQGADITGWALSSLVLAVGLQFCAIV
jgi:hypothetical protein